MEVILRFMAFLLKCLGYLAVPFLIVFNSHKKVKIPPIKNDLLKLPVVDLAEKIRAKEVSSRHGISQTDVLKLNRSHQFAISENLHLAANKKETNKFEMRN